MAKERSLIGWVLKNFINSIKPRNFWGELKGRDELGVEYYEDTTTLRGKNPSRWFAAPKGVGSHPDLPVEWEAWLRHKRKLPPTEEEIHLNRLKKMKTIENAMKLQTPKEEKKEIKPFNKPAFPIYEGFSTDPTIPETKNDKQ